MANPTSEKQLLMLVNLSRVSGRSLLSRTLLELNRHPNWKLRIIQVQETPVADIASALRDPALDGIISSEMELKPVADFLEKDDRPLVVIGTRRTCIPSRRKNVTFIRYREELIGETGARYLMSLGKFRTFAFVHYSEREYGYLSSLRKKGFRQELESQRFKWTTFGDPRHVGDADRERMREWLKGIPKPAAIMVGCDKRAVEVLDACTQLKIAVPDDISVVSVDNDEFLCHSTRPPLSSIQTNIGDMGEQAIRELDLLLRRRTPAATPRKVIIESSCRLFERASSAALSPGMHLCREALAFISANAHRNLKVDDVVAHLGVSRRLADLRFREFQKESILEAITRVRLEEVARRLRTDVSPIGTIIADCGFRNAGHLETLFKRRFGVTMRDYRKSPRPNAARSGDKRASKTTR